MKSLALQCADGAEVPLTGHIPRHPGGGDRCLPLQTTSALVLGLVRAEIARGRRRWMQLVISLDGIDLAFWLPAELDHVAEVFRTRPFPTARTLAQRDPGEGLLNQHWLSRLPKAAKAARFRARFLTLVQADPPEIAAFRRFYAAPPSVGGGSRTREW
jgi:hypothetical protein